MGVGIINPQVINTKTITILHHIIGGRIIIVVIVMVEVVLLLGPPTYPPINFRRI